MNSPIETYATSLLSEECGEVCQMAGKAGRFGIESPHSVNGEPVKGVPTCRAALTKECGDVLAAVDYAIRRGVISGPMVQHQRELKLKKLLDPESRDFLGRRLAP